MFRHAQPAHHHACRCREAQHTPHSFARQRRALATRSTAMSAFVDRAAVESGDETDAEQSDGGAMCVDGYYDLGDGFVVGPRRGERCH